MEKSDYNGNRASNDARVSVLFDALDSAQAEIKALKLRKGALAFVGAMLAGFTLALCGMGIADEMRSEAEPRPAAGYLDVPSWVAGRDVGYGYGKQDACRDVQTEAWDRGYTAGKIDAVHFSDPAVFTFRVTSRSAPGVLSATEVKP